jgi:hypothetical protein
MGLRAHQERRGGPPTWHQIHQLEIREDYPAAVEALEERVRADPNETETVIRLGFNLWYATAEEARLRNGIPIEEYAARFMALLRAYGESLGDNADFCWAFGLGIHLFWHMFPGATAEMGRSLLQRAAQLDEFWRQFSEGEIPAEECAKRFADRGIFASYYAVA